MSTTQSSPSQGDSIDVRPIQYGVLARKQGEISENATPIPLARPICLLLIGYHKPRSHSGIPTSLCWMAQALHALTTGNIFYPAWQADSDEAGR
jgi:hypothetical protein